MKSNFSKEGFRLSMLSTLFESTPGILLICSLLLLPSASIWSQGNWEVGLTGGLTHSNEFMRSAIKVFPEHEIRRNTMSMNRGIYLNRTIERFEKPFEYGFYLRYQSMDFGFERAKAQDGFGVLSMKADYLFRIHDVSGGFSLHHYFKGKGPNNWFVGIRAGYGAFIAEEVKVHSRVQTHMESNPRHYHFHMREVSNLNPMSMIEENRLNFQGSIEFGVQRPLGKYHLSVFAAPQAVYLIDDAWTFLFNLGLGFRF